MQSATEVQCILELKAQLCEGLHWDADDRCLWGVDIHGARVWRWDLSSPRWDEWDVNERVGWVLPEAGGGRLLLGLQSGFALVDRSRPDMPPHWKIDPLGGRAEMRLNDAKADRHGTVWAGSLNNDDESRADGALFRLDRLGQCSVADTGYTVANGPAIHPAGTWMLHTDSGRRTLYAFDISPDGRSLRSKRVWKQFDEVDGYPDGMCFDAEGAVWVAHWAAGCISRFAPDGSLLRRVRIPAAHVTNVCFGGPGLDRLFVSTARAGLTAGALQAQPLAGSLFEVLAPGARGLAGLPCGPFGT